jgi:receptor activity modifying protein 1
VGEAREEVMPMVTVLVSITAHHLFMVTACQDAHYGTLIQELCLARFKEDMEAVGRPLWCDWGKTIK